MKRWLCVLCALMIMLASSAAFALDMDGALTAYLGNEARFVLGMELESLYPYGESTVELLNLALTPMRLHVDLQSDVSFMQLNVSDNEAFSLTQTEGESGSTLTTSLLPNRTLISAGSVMDALNGLNEAQEEKFDLLAALGEAQDCYQTLAEAIVPYAEEKKANYKISGVGHAKWVRLARLTAEQSAAIQPEIVRLLACGMDAAFREELQNLVCAKGFVVALYQTEQSGADIAMYMKGSVKLEDGVTRTVSYQWAFNETAERRKDAYKLEIKRSKSPADNRGIAATLARTPSNEAYVLDGKCDMTFKVGASTVKTSWLYELEGSEKNGFRALGGEASVTTKTTADGKSLTVIQTIAPKLSLNVATHALEGTLTLQEKQGKNILTSVALTFGTPEPLGAAADAEPQSGASNSPDAEITIVSSLDQNLEVENDSQAGASGSTAYQVGAPPLGLNVYTAPAVPQTIDVDALLPDTMHALTDEMAQRLAGRLLVLLAETDGVALLRDNMTDEDYASFLQLLQGI